MNPIIRLGIFSAALALLSPAWAEDPVLTSSLSASRVETVDGKAVLQPADEAKPGDLLEYRAVYTNHGSASIAHLQATVPVPPGTTLVADSPLPAAAQASTDARNFAPMPLQRRVMTPDGKSRLEAVPLTEIRAVRWDIGSLPAGKAAAVSLHVRINPPLLSLSDTH
jgi:uncharacterized repeat protein (TIGR01451 family)